MIFNPDLPTPNKKLSTIYTNNTGFIFDTSGISIKEIYEKHTGD